MLQCLLDCLTLGNAVLFLLSILMLNLLWVLYDLRNMPPGPRFTSWPVVGNLFSLDSSIDIHQATKRLEKTYGRVFTLKLGSWRVVWISEPDAIKEVLVKKSADYAGRPPFHSLQVETLGGKDIVAGYGPAWRLHRKLFMTTLRQFLSNVAQTESRVGEQTANLLKYFEETQGQSFDPKGILEKSVADIICGITFANYFNSSHPEFDKFMSVWDKSFGDVKLNETISFLDFFPIAKYFPFKAYKEIQDMTDYVCDVLQHLLDERKKSFDPSEPGCDLMSLLLKAREEAELENEEENREALTDDYLINTLGDMFGAGYETTSSTLRWALLYLVNNPQYQKEIQTALDEVVGQERAPSLDDRQALPIVQATIMETQRLGNVADFTVPHYTVKDTTLKGYRMPKDTVVMVDLLALHTDPQCWPDPMTFNPHRHLDAEGQLITNQGNWLPFSAGRRVCAGEALAKVELFLFLTCMLQKYTFVPEEGKKELAVEPNRGFTRTPKPFKIRAIERE